MILEVLIETIKRTAGIAAVIVVLLFLVEYLNHRYGDKMIHWFEKKQKFLPFWTALFALLPGCNAAAATATLYAKGYLSFGALLAAMIATSDEAIYVFIPQKFNFLPLYGAKFALALVAGFGIDLFLKVRAEKNGKVDLEYCCSIHSHEHSHNLFGMLKHTAKHAGKIVFFIFIVLFLFNLAKDTAGFDNFASSAIAGSAFQPLFAGLFGLIPGCGTSVVLATLYTQGILSFAGAVAGLSAASGDTLLVLLANKVERRSIFVTLSIVLVVSIMGGYLVNLF